MQMIKFLMHVDQVKMIHVTTPTINHGLMKNVLKQGICLP